MDIKISKKLIGILRHGAQKRGIPINQNGEVLISDLLKQPDFKNVSIQKIMEIVANCPKQRFKISDNELYIKANQGHSIKINTDECMTKLTPQNLTDHHIDPSIIVHGTYFESWTKIKNSVGLSRMKRQHIHFGIQIPEDGEVISGMRKSCQVIIYLDIIRAMEAGIVFYLSDNKVVLSEGNSSGFIPKEYFSKIINRNTKMELYHL